MILGSRRKSGSLHIGLLVRSLKGTAVLSHYFVSFVLSSVNAVLLLEVLHNTSQKLLTNKMYKHGFDINVI